MRTPCAKMSMTGTHELLPGRAGRLQPKDPCPNVLLVMLGTIASHRLILPNPGYQQLPRGRRPCSIEASL